MRVFDLWSDAESSYTIRRRGNWYLSSATYDLSMLRSTANSQNVCVLASLMMVGGLTKNEQCGECDDR